MKIFMCIQMYNDSDSYNLFTQNVPISTLNSIISYLLPSTVHRGQDEDQPKSSGGSSMGELKVQIM